MTALPNDRNGYRIVNIVALADFRRELDLTKVLRTSNMLRYTRRSESSLLIRFTHPNVLLRVLKSGKVRLTGGKSVEEIRGALSELTSVLRKSGISAGRPSLRIMNMVAVSDLGSLTNLTRLFVKNQENASYEPEQFPGLVLRTRNGPTALIFGSGKFVVTGAKSRRDLALTIARIKALVEC